MTYVTFGSIPAQKSEVSVRYLTPGSLPIGRLPLTQRYLGQPFALPAQEGAESEPVIKIGQRRRIRPAAAQTLHVNTELHVTRDMRELPRQKHGFAMFAQA